MARVVLFKNEGEIDGEPYGPAFAIDADKIGEPVPFDPNRERPEWVTRTTAQEMADTLGLELRTS